MDDQVLNFSPETLNERRRLIYIIMGVVPVLTGVFGYIFASLDGRLNFPKMIFIIAIVIPFILIELIIVSKIMLKKVSEIKLIISDSQIKRIGGKHEEVIIYGDIRSIMVKRNVTGNILYIKIRQNNKSVSLSGFEDMDKVLLYLTDNIEDNIKDEIKDTQYKVDWNNPFIVIATMILTAMIIILMVKLNMNIYRAFNVIFPILVSLLFIILKPISTNAGKRFRKFEVTISILLIVSEVFIVIGYIM